MLLREITVSLSYVTILFGIKNACNDLHNCFCLSFGFQLRVFASEDAFPFSTNGEKQHGNSYSKVDDPIFVLAKNSNFIYPFEYVLSTDV